MHIVGFFIISVEIANFRNEEVIERLLSFKKKIFWGICSSQLFFFFGGGRLSQEINESWKCWLGVHILQIDGNLFPKFMHKLRQIDGDLFPNFMCKLRHFWIICI